MGTIPDVEMQGARRNVPIRPHMRGQEPTFLAIPQPENKADSLAKTPVYNITPKITNNPPLICEMTVR